MLIDCFFMGNGRQMAVGGEEKKECGREYQFGTGVDHFYLD